MTIIEAREEVLSNKLITIQHPLGEDTNAKPSALLRRSIIRSRPTGRSHDGELITHILLSNWKGLGLGLVVRKAIHGRHLMTRCRLMMDSGNSIVSVRSAPICSPRINHRFRSWTTPAV